MKSFTALLKYIVAVLTIVTTSLAYAVPITSMLGDDDGFGLGLVEGDTRPPSLGNFDLREPDDPDFTDHAPASSGVGVDDDIVYTQNLGGPFSSIVFAELQFFALGIQDGDSQVFQSDIDLRLFLDGEEVAGAFDTIDQFDFIDGQFVEIAGLVTIPIPVSIFDVFLDGAVDVRIENLQLDPDAVSIGDSIALDFSRFNLDADMVATVPEPGTLALLGVGLFGMGLARRRKVKRVG